MKNRKILFVFAALMTLILFGILVYIPLTGCDGPHCCPKVDENSITHTSIICDPTCPGGGKVEAYGTLEFYRAEEICEPPADFRIYIYNVTDAKEEAPLDIQNANPGVYSFKAVFKLDHDATFELRAIGDKECGTKSQTFKVRVLKKDEIETSHLKFTEKKNWPLKNLVWNRHVYFGSGIVLDTVSNENGFKVDVDAVYLKNQHLMKKGDAGDKAYPPKTMSATGEYIVRIPDEPSYKIYAGQTPPVIDLALVVRCGCK